MENKDGDDAGSIKCDHHSDDSGSCVVTSDSGSKLECSAEVIKDDDNDIDGKSVSDVLCPQKRRKTEENDGPNEAENEGHIFIFGSNNSSL